MSSATLPHARVPETASGGRRPPRLALVGRPNVGKSALFGALTGGYAAVSNYPGTTVELFHGRAFAGGREWLVTDTPGLRSLRPGSEEERVARDHLLDDPPDVLVHVADAKDLAGSLRLTLELAALDVPLVLVLNMADEARRAGRGIDAARLSALLRVPVVETVAVTGEGMGELKLALARAGLCDRSASELQELARARAGLARRLPPGCARPEAVAELLLRGDETAEDWLLDRLGGATREGRRSRAGFVRDPEHLWRLAREAGAHELAAQSSWRRESGRPSAGDKLGMLLLRPLPGAAAALAALASLYLVVGLLAAGKLADFLGRVLFAERLVPWVARALESAAAPSWASELLTGETGLVSMGLSYALATVLPVVSAFFLFFALLEDSGYLPRLSVLLDRLFRGLGLNGKAVFPLVLGLGCGTMATLTVRVLDTRRERLLMTFLLALAVPCSAQLGVVLGLLSGLSPAAAAVWLGTVLAAFLGAGGLAARLLPGARAPFWIELPPLRLPRAGNLLRKTGVRVRWYMREAVPLFLLGTLLLHVLSRTGGLARLETALAPLVTGWLGLPREATFALVGGFLKRDYGAAGFFDLARRGLLGPEQTVTGLVVLTLMLPCVAQFLVMLRERGARAGLAAAAAATGLAVLAGGLVRLALAAAGGLPG